MTRGKSLNSEEAGSRCPARSRLFRAERKAVPTAFIWEWMSELIYLRGNRGAKGCGGLTYCCTDTLAVVDHWVDACIVSCGRWG